MAAQTLNPEDKAKIRFGCSIVLGVHPDELIGDDLLGTLQDAEACGATILWGTLPDPAEMDGMTL